MPFPSPVSESEVVQLCPTLSDPMKCRPPGSSVHGIFQARVLEWGAIAFSGTSTIWDQICFFVHLREWQMAASCIPLAPQQSLRGVAASAGSKFWDPSFTFGGQKLLMVVTFLVY